jgi:hypothetical protein
LGGDSLPYEASRDVLWEFQALGHVSCLKERGA